jgi:hypothetical protein
VICEATLEEFDERVARSSQIDRASNEASCHSRFLSARDADSRREGKNFIRRSVLGLEVNSDDRDMIPWFLKDEIALKVSKPLNCIEV